MDSAVLRVAPAKSQPDAWLLEALKSGHPGAPALLFDRYAPTIERVLARVMGWDDELGDLLHEVFARALRGVAQLEEPERLGAWLTSIAIFTARNCIRGRRRWRLFGAPSSTGELPEVAAQSGGTASDEVREATRRTYALLDRLSADLRIVFALRYIEGMELTEIAEACDISLATVKRRLAKADERFVALARRDEVLRRWLSEGRWAER